MTRDDRSPEQDLEGLLEELERLEAETLDRGADSEVPGSAWTIGQHAQHVLLALDHTGRALDLLGAGADERIQRALPERRSDDYAPPAVVERLLGSGRIPRGEAEAPPHVVPDDHVSTVRAAELFREQRNGWRGRNPRLAGCGAWSGWLPHPILGPLSARQWVRFAFVHTRHHREIVTAPARNP